MFDEKPVVVIVSVAVMLWFGKMKQKTVLWERLKN